MNRKLNFNWIKAKNRHYAKRYIYLIKNILLLNRGLDPQEGYHIHHICPKSSGGDDSLNNLIKVSIREHRILHRCLAKATGNKADWHSAKSLYKTQKIKNTEEYEIWRKECSIRQKERWKNPIYHHQVSSNMKGRIPWNLGGECYSEDQIKRMSESHLGNKIPKEVIEKRSKTVKENQQKYLWSINGEIKKLSAPELYNNYNISSGSVYKLIKKQSNCIKRISLISSIN